MTNNPEVIIYSNFINIKNKTGVYCLVDMESCMSCSQYMKDLKKYNISDWTIVAMTEENSKKLFEDEGLKPPITRVYNNGSIVEEIRGILYSAQIKKIYNCLYSIIGSNNKISTMSFSTLSAKQKSINIQCFKVKKILDVEILGQKVLAREGQWIVMYDDNKLEVLDDIDFNRRFELL